MDPNDSSSTISPSFGDSSGSDDSNGVVISWSGIYVTLITSFLQGLIFYIFFLRQRKIELDNKQSYDIYEPRQYKYGHRSPPPFTTRTTNDNTTTKSNNNNTTTTTTQRESWWYEAYHRSDDELLRCVGLDTLMYIRLLRLGARITCCGIILGCFVLIPVYASGDAIGPATEQFNSLTIAKVSNSSPRLWATVVSYWIYINFILLEIRYEWTYYKIQRQNYMLWGGTHTDDINASLLYRKTVRIEGIPEQYNQTEHQLYIYMNNLFPKQINTVVCCLQIDTLHKLINERSTNILTLESIVAYKHTYPEKPTKVYKKYGDAILYHEKEISRLNNEIDTIRTTILSAEYNNNNHHHHHHTLTATTSVVSQNVSKYNTANNNNDQHDVEDEIDVTEGVEVVLDPAMKNKITNTTTTTNNNNKNNISTTAGNNSGIVGSGTTQQSKDKNAKMNTGTNSTGTLTDNTNRYVSSTAFVTFNTMQSKSVALQCDFNGNPNSMVVHPAVDPKSMIWENITMSHGQQTIRIIQSSVVWIVGIVFWAFPVLFVVSISNLNSILVLIGVGEVNPNLVWYGLIAGLLPVIALAILMIVLYMSIEACAKYFIKYKSYSEIDTYTLYWHQLFQFANLWLILMGGSIFNQIDTLIDSADITAVVETIANALPGASPFFINMILLSTFGSLGMELSMLPTYGIQLIVSLIQPTSLKTQRQLDDSKNNPPSIVWGKQVPPLIFIFMVSFMYMPIVPIIELFAFVYFAGMYIVWKHQCLHVYAQGNLESGGVTTFQVVYTFLLSCLYVSECVFIAYMAIKQAPVQALAGFVPLIITYLVNMELQRNIIRPLQYLPLEVARAIDRKEELERKHTNTNATTFGKEVQNTNESSVFRQPALDRNQDERGPMPYRRTTDETVKMNDEYDENNNNKKNNNKNVVVDDDNNNIKNYRNNENIAISTEEDDIEQQYILPNEDVDGDDRNYADGTASNSHNKSTRKRTVTTTSPASSSPTSPKDLIARCTSYNNLDAQATTPYETINTDDEC